MYMFLAIVTVIIVYIVSFKHEFRKEEFGKTIPIMVVIGILTLVASL